MIWMILLLRWSLQVENLLRVPVKNLRIVKLVSWMLEKAMAITTKKGTQGKRLWPAISVERWSTIKVLKTISKSTQEINPMFVPNAQKPSLRVEILLDTWEFTPASDLTPAIIVERHSSRCWVSGDTTRRLIVDHHWHFLVITVNNLSLWHRTFELIRGHTMRRIHSLVTNVTKSLLVLWNWENTKQIIQQKGKSPFYLAIIAKDYSGVWTTLKCTEDVMWVLLPLGQNKVFGTFLFVRKVSLMLI